MLPPVLNTSRKCSQAPTFSEPLNIMCSKRWANPVRPLRSSRDPTLYVTAIDTTGATWSSAIITRSPFCNFVSVNVTLGVVAAEASAVRTQMPAADSHFRRWREHIDTSCPFGTDNPGAEGTEYYRWEYRGPSCDAGYSNFCSRGEALAGGTLAS